MRNHALYLGLLALPVLPPLCQAATLSTMTPAQPLSEARVATLPPAQQGPWKDYLARSRALMAADKAQLAAEGPLDTTPRPHGAGDGGMTLRQSAAWYGTADALRIADNILGFQTPAGGWGKNSDRSGALRRKGEPWVPFETGQTKLSWNYVGTFDNGATTNELRFLARVQAKFDAARGEPYRAAFAKGLRYILNAQYPNGGFPQVYPLQGGYHDAVTLNDDAMVRVVTLLNDVADGRGDFAFVPAPAREEARAAVGRAVAMFLAAQQRSVDGRLTGWGQQHDTLTLALVGARNFEPASLASAESASVLQFLMRQPDPSPALREAVHGGVAWLRAAALRDVAWKQTPNGRQLAPAPGAPAIWARYYDAQTLKPIFGDRDRSIHDDVNELQVERRNGYAWFGAVPAKAIERYAAWAGGASRPRLVLVGDSTMAPKGGYGDALCRRLEPQVACVNLGRAGRSTSSYRAEGHWDRVVKLLGEQGGHSTTYVMIGFGHNDQPGKPGRSTDLKTEFPVNMGRYASEAQAAGAIAVLATPLARRTFEGGKLLDTLAPWAAATRAVASERKLAVVDVHAATLAAFGELGEARTVTLGPPPKPDAKGPDLTHLNEEGAQIVAPIVLKALQRAVPALSTPSP
ncbi:pectate lyase [Massilia sp. G4R7]|uniref:Pectate lyase n=1 Tax=Massilia phyllostachyos TaxID=2898585 RepID=A0ABS8Q9H8_9BURK|nr:pectate lyase [Massilia phyllostachyos]MCD2518411.1 pectate lyase [Massilia phyllostachyos]